MSFLGIIAVIVVGMIVAFAAFFTSSLLKDLELWTGPYFREVPDGKNPSQTLEYVGPSNFLIETE